MQCHALRAFGVLWALMLPTALPSLSYAQESPAAAPEADEESSASEVDGPETFLDAITVSTTRSVRTIGETAGTTAVIDVAEIENQLMIDAQDLVRYEPGVYVDSDPTRLGLNGFNIRGIGGNRVLTQIDGIPTAEEFDFGPLAATQVSIDLANLQSAEVVRSAGSSLYGSDALGGVVALLTKSPRDLLGSSRSALSGSVGYSGRNEEPSASLSLAGRSDKWLGSLFLSGRQSSETDNQGELSTNDATRTAPNPLESDQANVLAKATRVLSDSNEIEFAAELRDIETDTSVVSSQGVIDFSFVLPPGGQFLIDVSDVDAMDRQERQRFSLRQLAVVQLPIFDEISWQAYATSTETSQVVDEFRTNTVSFFGPPSVTNVARRGTFEFDQQTMGGEVQLRKAFGTTTNHRLVYGLSVREDSFDVLRDREDIDVDTQAVVPSSLIFPTKYFPQSDVVELGMYVQDEIEMLGGRLLLVPGLRFDQYELKPDANDSVFLTGNPGQAPPVGLKDSALSPRLGLVAGLGEKSTFFAQYSSGFRAPPYSAVNNGFTNQAGGYQTLANPDLESETSQNLEAGVRFAIASGAISLTYFNNSYEDFIDTVTLGFNPQTFLLEFQPQNIDEVEISGFELSTDHRLGKSLRLRTAWSYIEGENSTSGTPLTSISPPEVVVGLEYRPAGARWDASVVTKVVDNKSEGDLPDGRFAAPGYETLDLFVGYRLNEHLDLRLAAFNLSDETYWDWASARGLTATSGVVDRFTSPGRQLALALRFTK